MTYALNCKVVNSGLNTFICKQFRGRDCAVTGGVLLTSAWPPAFRSLLQRSHLRHNLCQSFPSDDTFSAAHGRQMTRQKANIPIKQRYDK